MAKFKIQLSVEVEGDDVDEAVTRAAIYLALNASSRRPILTVPPQGSYEFPAPRNYNVIEDLGKMMFKDDKNYRMEKVVLNVEPAEAWPSPPGLM